MNDPFLNNLEEQKKIYQMLQHQSGTLGNWVMALLYMLGGEAKLDPICLMKVEAGGTAVMARKDANGNIYLRVVSNEEIPNQKLAGVASV